MNIYVRNTYRVIRSILFTAIILVAALYLILYVLLSIPSVQSRIKKVAEVELTKLFGGELSIGNLEIYPFNEVVLKDVILKDPGKNKCISVGKIGAGINLWRLIYDKKIEITYAELIYPDVRLFKRNKDSKLNIQFLIDALSPKDKNKPPTQFDLKIHKIVIRGGNLTFDKKWMPNNNTREKIDFNHIKLEEICADIELPRLKNDEIEIDLRRLAFEIPGLLTVDKIGCKALISQNSLSISQLVIQLPGSDIRPNDISLNVHSIGEFSEIFKNSNLSFYLTDNRITPSDFRGFLPQLAFFSDPLIVNVEINGNINDLTIHRLNILDNENSSGISFKGHLSSLQKIDSAVLDLESLNLIASSELSKRIIRYFPSIPERIADIINRAGNLRLDISGFASLGDKIFETDGIISMSVGDIDFSLSGFGYADNFKVKGGVAASNLDVGALFGTDKIGCVTMNVNGDVSISGKNPNGFINLDVNSIELQKKNLTNISANLSKEGNKIYVETSIDDPSVELALSGEAVIAGEGSSLSLDADMKGFRPSDFFILPKFDGYTFSGDISTVLSGSSIDNLNGSLDLRDFSATGGSGRDWNLDKLQIDINQSESFRSFIVSSDWLDASLQGDFVPSKLPGLMQGLLSEAIPTLVSPPLTDWHADAGGMYQINISKDSPLFKIFNIPFKSVQDITFSGNFTGNPGNFSFETSIPYIIQGKDKLIRDLMVNISLDENDHLAKLLLGVIYPTKKGDLKLDAYLSSVSDKIGISIDFNKGRDVSFNGTLNLEALVKRNLIDRSLEGNLHIIPSEFYLNNAEWKLNEAEIDYSDRQLNISDFSLRHEDQFIAINGIAGASENQILDIGLSDIDLAYIFDTLNINYVSFGGFASGEIQASGVLSGNPQAATKRLFVKDLSYNGAKLGDGDIESHWKNDIKCVSLDALINENNKNVVKMKGGIWVAKDSLSFDFDADKVNVAFLQPFMEAFASKFNGRASGRALLYGTFKDIDLKGDLYADTVSLKLAFTNVEYSGSDSVRITPGKIEIPRFRLYDKYGNSADLTGNLTHRYFHEPSFDFRLTHVDKLLCYDTNQSLNPDWWGTIFASGTASVTGFPGFVNVSANMITENNSQFTFVINDRLDADDYHFLTFTDRKKAQEENKLLKEEPEYLSLIRQHKTQEEGPPTIFEMNLRVDVTPKADLTIIMDPSGGDKITAQGSGSLSMGYNSGSDELTMFGRYTLEQGVYNFTLQDLILKDFIIKQGSSIAFNGNPLDATLNISAAYRVNTNLTDLDKSFATDRELNRTNVPVDALLNVTGEMTTPNVTFDIDLPTLTEETARKVRSIISTEDMMSKQIIYLLALNRFYTPEYMGISSNGGEWASMASSTISSQLSSMLGKLTDKVNVIPSLRSDKGDFSDVEVDVALSSRLFNNRLLINGNFGYRDHSTSNTTFVGDFDIEYILSSNGNLRLKAYNHFNDQNYYLRSALTTQGLGIIYRKEFNNPFSFLKPRRKKSSEVTDSISN